MATKRKVVDFEKATSKAAASSVTIDRFANASAFIEKRAQQLTESSSVSSGADESINPSGQKGPAQSKAGDQQGRAPAIPQSADPAVSIAPTTPSVIKARLGSELLTQVDSAGLAGRACAFVRAHVDQVDDNPFNARYVYQPEKVAALAQSMNRDGQLVPGIATQRNGRYVLAAAHYRKRAIILNGMKTIDLLVYDDMTDEQLYITSYKENAEHTVQTSLDNALAWKNLLEKKVFASEVAIAEAVGLSKSNVNKTLAILDLPKAVIGIIEQDPASFALSSLYELTLLAKVAKQEQVISMAQGLLEGEIGRKEIQILRVRIASGRGEKPKAQAYQTSRQHRFFNAGQRVGHIKEWDSGKVVFEMVFDSREAQQAWIGEMRERFNEAEKNLNKAHTNSDQAVNAG